MTNGEILIKAVGKAVGNGFDWEKLANAISTNSYRTFEEWIKKENILWYWHFQIIFSHPFAKAFWGEEASKKDARVLDEHPNGFFGIGVNPLWKICLIQMVLEEEPLKYLEKFLDD